MSADKPPEPIFGAVPPEGACAVRIRLRLNRRGNPPSLTCTTLTEEAVQTEIDASLVFRRTLEAVHKQKSYGVKPWVVEVDVQFLGSDGKAIDAPAPAEISYFGPEEPDGAQPLTDNRSPSAFPAASTASGAVSIGAGRISPRLTVATNLPVAGERIGANDDSAAAGAVSRGCGKPSRRSASGTASSASMVDSGRRWAKGPICARSPMIELWATV